MTEVVKVKKTFNSSAEMMKIANDESMNKSQKIRALYDLTKDRSHIANLLQIRYQHVRNVLITPIKKTA